MPFLLGLTGNIACGKTSVGQLLTERFGAEYVDADRLVHALYAPGTPETRAIAQRFGDELVQPDGTIDRRRLADIVLGDRSALRDLEAILDPAVMRAIAARVAQTSARVLVLDAIRLVESGLSDRCDTLWVVVCDRASQIQRLQASRGLSAEQAALRVEAQTPAEDKLRHARAVISNTGTLDELAEQVAAAWARTVAPRLGPS